jgi:hypothetical protein
MAWEGTGGRAWLESIPATCWSLTNNGISGLRVLALGFDPHTAGTILSGALTNSGWGVGVYRSTNGGAAWTTHSSTRWSMIRKRVGPSTRGRKRLQEHR